MMGKEDRYRQVAMAAAKEAGRIQMEHFGHSHSVEYKGEIDPVTIVDKLCDQTIADRISKAFPNHDLLTEERPSEIKGSPWKWIIDPLDGTTNYLHGYPCFCVSIGLEVENEMRLGVVYNPVLDELFYAEKGEGAYLNGNRLSVSRESHLGRSLLCTGFPYDIRENGDFYLRYFRQLMMKSFGIRRPGSAAIDLCYLAAGRFDGFWEFKLHSWDMAAGSLMITEAGGKVTDFKGEAFNIYSGEILASNGLIHQEMLQAMGEINSTERD